MRIIVLGGDGFCGWPTSLHLSNAGHEVIIIDNLSRRRIDNELEVDSLTPIRHMGVRLRTWQELTGNNIEFFNIDVAKEYVSLVDLVREKSPDVIVHFAEQRAAPYSMKGVKQKIYTVDNNLNATHNVLCAIVESRLDIHLVHLGTMGVYGYTSAGIKIPEGYLNVKIENSDGGLVDREVLYPPSPGSVYHMTKTQDQLFFQFYNINDKLRITDLHQGIVWGTNTLETLMSEDLINRFDYDGDYGTVLNRFLMQSALDYPLTVHGTGGQTRAFIHIKDTVKCIQLALESPPASGDRVRILNQLTEAHKVRDLATLVSKNTGSRIVYLKNPRNEATENELDVSNAGLIELGLTPTTLENGLMEEVRDIAKKYSERCDPTKIISKSYWSESNKPDDEIKIDKL